MKKEFEDILALVNATVTNSQVKLSEEPDWDTLIPLLRKGRVFTVVYRTVANLQGLRAVPEDLLKKWKEETFSKGFYQLEAIYELRRVLDEANRRGIQLIVIKGLALALLYPEPYMRTTSDADLYVSKEKRALAEKMLEEIGYQKIDGLSKEHVPTYVVSDNKRRLAIELHDQLWEDYEGKQVTILESLRLDAAEKLIMNQFEGFEFTTLGYDEHLIFQIFHIAKHFFFEGISLRYLVDIQLYIDKYAEHINLPAVREKLVLLHYEKLYDTILRVCQDYMGMKTVIATPTLLDAKVNESFINDVIGKEKIHDSVKSWETINFLNTYFVRSSVTKSSRFQQKRKQLFPLPSELNIKYNYAKKCPLLLPFAWVHRAAYLASYSRHCKRNGFDVSTSIAKAQYRLDLMRELDLTDTEVK